MTQVRQNEMQKLSKVSSLNSCTIPACNWKNRDTQPGNQYTDVYSTNKLVVLQETWLFNI
jgi:hypothetical protein